MPASAIATVYARTLTNPVVLVLAAEIAATGTPTVAGAVTAVDGGSMLAGGCSSAGSTPTPGTGAALAVGAATGCGADLTTARPRRPAGGIATGSATDVMSVRPPTPGVTLIRPSDDQRASRRRTLVALQSQSRASAAALVSVFPFAAIQASASSFESARIGTTFASDVAATPTAAPK